MASPVRRLRTGDQIRFEVFEGEDPSVVKEVESLYSKYEEMWLEIGNTNQHIRIDKVASILEDGDWVVLVYGTLL